MKRLLCILAVQAWAWALPSAEQLQQQFLKSHPNESAEHVRIVEAPELDAASAGTFLSDRGYRLKAVYQDGQFREPGEAAGRLLKDWAQSSPAQQEELALKIATKLLWVFDSPQETEVSRNHGLVQVSAKLAYSGMRGRVEWIDKWIVDSQGKIKHETGD